MDDRSERGGEVVSLRALPDEREVPDPPKGLLKKTAEWWESLWLSDLMVAVGAPSDFSAVERLALLMDERERCYRTVRKEGRTSVGSQDQIVEHPLYKKMSVLDSEIRQLEDRFGLNPRARVNLGVQLGQLRRSLDDTNSFSETPEVDDYLEG